MPPMTNDELIKHRSRIFRGYRAPQVVSDFESRGRLVSITRDGAGFTTQIVQEMTNPDGTQVLRTTDFVLDENGNVESTTVTFSYEDTTP